jgi:hypothetical protein
MSCHSHSRPTDVIRFNFFRLRITMTQPTPEDFKREKVQEAFEIANKNEPVEFRDWLNATLDETIELGRTQPYAHDTADGEWCCACDYDIIELNHRIKKFGERCLALYHDSFNDYAGPTKSLEDIIKDELKKLSTTTS